MKPVKFLALFGQPELFPERASVGQEVTALMIATLSGQPPLRAASMHRVDLAEQQRLPMANVRRSWGRR